MKLKMIFLCILTVFNLSLSAQNWEIMTVGGGVKPSIAVDKEGKAHIAYMLEAIPGFLKYAVRENNSFTITEIDQAYYYGPLDIAIDKDGLPGIALHNHDQEDENIYRLDFSGAWVQERIEDQGHDGWDNSLAFDSNNYPHTSSIDPSQFGSSDGVEYSWYDGSQWHKESIGSGPKVYQFSTCIDVDNKDVPHISYFDNLTTSLKYAHKTGGSWTIETVSAEGGMFSSLVLDSIDQPHISFYAQTGSTEGDIKYAWYDGNNWNIEIIDKLLNVPIAFSGARNVTSMQMDAQGRIHLGYGDRDVIKYAVKENGSWIIETVVDESNSSTLLGAQCSLALGPDAEPYLTYFEVTSLNPLNGVVKYAQKESSTATVQAILMKNSFQLYPNPATNLLVLEVDEPVIQKANIMIHDVNGRVMLRWTDLEINSKILLNIDKLNPGIYFLVLNATVGLFEEKIVVSE